MKKFIPYIAAIGLSLGFGCTSPKTGYSLPEINWQPEAVVSEMSHKEYIGYLEARIKEIDVYNTALKTLTDELEGTIEPLRKVDFTENKSSSDLESKVNPK